MLSIRTGQRCISTRAVRHPELKEKSIIRGMRTAASARIRLSATARSAPCRCVCWAIKRRMSVRSACRLYRAGTGHRSDGRCHDCGCACCSQARRRGGASLNALNTDKRRRRQHTARTRSRPRRSRTAFLPRPERHMQRPAADAALFYEDGVVDAESPARPPVCWTAA